MGHRADLLAGAKQCLVDKGYAHTTARDIVAASGTNLASIGYHFGTKEALLNAAVIDSFNDWDDEVANTAKTAGDDATAVGRLQGFLAGVIEAVSNHRPIAVASVHAFAQFAHSDTMHDNLDDVFREARRELSAVVLKVDPEDVDDETARSVGSLGLALVNGITLQWLINPDIAPSATDITAALRRLAGETG